MTPAPAQDGLSDSDIKRLAQSFRDSGAVSLEITYGPARISLCQPGGDGAACNETLETVASPKLGIFHDEGRSQDTAEGQPVSGDAVLGVVKSLKGETEIRAGIAGVIAAKLVTDGTFVSYGDALFHIDPATGTPGREGGCGA